jgi:argininosuccinate synthase
MKIVLAYSGGLDTSVLLKYLHEKYNADIVAVTANLGEGKDLEEVRERALKVGATAAYTLDLREEFAEGYVLPSIKANGLYEGVYPLVSALSRPLIVKKLVEVAKKESADAVAHCAGLTSTSGAAAASGLLSPCAREYIAHARAASFGDVDGLNWTGN